jgi:MYXO-CTERM domain-containing protein
MGRAGQAVRAGGLALIGALAVLAVGFDAGADVVMPPPEDCPIGTVGTSSHGGPRCVPVYCPDAGGCPAGTFCQPHYYCAQDNYGIEILGVCGEGETCAEGSCELIDVCYGTTDGGAEPIDGGSGLSQGGLIDLDARLPLGADAGDGDGGAGPAPPSGTGHDGGCGCRVGAGSGSSAWAALALLLAVGAIRRRRWRILG